MKTIDRLKARAKGLERELVALALVYRDPRTPWYAKVMTVMVLAYALSPIDLIPDFIPILGLLDDLILVPAGILVVIRLIPREVMADARAKADLLEGQRKSALRYLGMGLVVTFWVILLAIVVYVAWGMFVK